MIKALYRKSRWIHKYAGLILVLFLMWMSISGIILNHPQLFAPISVPHALIPPTYKINNWNRSSLIGLVYSKQNPDVLYLYGKKGVWKSEDGGKTFVPWQNGFPRSRYYLKTNHLFLWENERPFLLAATDGGLYRAYLKEGRWHKVELPFKDEAVKKILFVRDRLLVFSESHVYGAPFPANELHFKTVPLKRAENRHSVTLVKLFFDLHDGQVWGLPGQLLVDVVGLILFFMSFSGFYIWFIPWRWRRRTKRNLKAIGYSKIRFIRWLVKYHLKIGIYVAFFFLILGSTAFFMRPPFLAVIANGSVDASWYPGKISPNPWQKKIQNALFDPQRDRLIIAASDGLWQGDVRFSRPFEKVDFHVPIFVMGPTVFEYQNGNYLIGSFNGLFLFDADSNSSRDVLTGQKVTTYSNIRPGEWMVTGYFKLSSGKQFLTTHDRGLWPLDGRQPSDRFAVPKQMNRDFTLSLWNYMFELHNGRIFQDIIGDFYILIPPLGSFLFVLITLTGIFDWIYIKLRHLKIAETTQKDYIEANTFEFESRREKE